MQATKRSWLLGGIGIPTDVALVRPTVSPRLPPGSRLLLVGDRHVASLTPALGRLCSDASVVLGVLSLLPETPPQAILDAIVEQLELTPAPVTLVSWPCSALVATAAREAGKAEHSSVAWLVAPAGCGAARAELSKAKVPVFRSDVLRLGLGPDGVTPTVSGYAGWAGAIWRWLR